MLRLLGFVLIAGVAAVPVESQAQGVDVGIAGRALLSIQPVDDTFVGGPYLNEGIGGIAPGFSAGIEVVFSNGFVLSGEYTTARFEREQHGRLVSGGVRTEAVPHTTRLRDSLISALAGYSTARGALRAQFLVGVSARLDRPTIDGVPRDDGPDTAANSVLPLVVSGGVDVVRWVGTRAALVLGARYFVIDRSENVQFLGIGPHVFRVSAGLRVRLN